MTMPDKKQAELYAAVRERGMLNMIKDTPALKYESLHPDMKCKWEHLPASGDRTMVTYREALGFHVVDAKELNPQLPSEQQTGQIRVGDLVLMAAPKEVFEELLRQDADAADKDYKAPEVAYREQLESKKYKTADGDIHSGRPIGKIVRKEEEVDPADFVTIPPAK